MYGPFLRTLNISCRIVMWIQKGTIILTTIHIELPSVACMVCPTPGLSSKTFAVLVPRVSKGIEATMLFPLVSQACNGLQ